MLISSRLWLLGAACLTTALLLTGCSGQQEERLAGERLSVLSLQESLKADDKSLLPPPNLPAAWSNEFWPQAGGYPNHSMQHLALGDDLQPLWRVDIGKGGSKDLPLVASPIIVNDMVITMDSRAHIKAFSTQDGTRLWDQDTWNKSKGERVVTGGLAYGENTLFVTTGFNELLALDIKTGEPLWQQTLPGASQVAPSVMDGRVYVLTIDNRLIALSTKDGAPLWDYLSTQEDTGIVGGASPAINREIVTGAFSSGELTALRVENGSVAWTEKLNNADRLGGLGSIADIKALPIIDKGLLIAMNYGGRMAAIDLRSGQRVWQRDLGGINTPWIAGDVIFALSSKQELVALNRQTGLIYWVHELPLYREPAKRRGALHWYGPLLAGNRLISISSDGEVVETAADSGETKTRWSLDEDIRTPPIVAGGKLYILCNDGTLRVYK